MQNWKIAEPIADEIKAKSSGINPVILQLLFNRGLSEAEEIEKFLHPRYEDLHDPFLFSDMRKFVERIKAAKESAEKICIYGDYDSDGVCSAALLVAALRQVDLQNIEIYIPHREREGYGLNRAAIDYLVEQGVKLLITVDCGSSNVAEVKYAQNFGLDVMILDHHEEPPELPQGVVAFLNPHLKNEPYPFKNLAAAGVVFKAAQALWQSFNLPPGGEKWLLDLVAIATVTDMVPLLGENRIFVKYGLKVLNKTRRPGLQSLIEVMRSAAGPLGVYEIGFMIGPRLNAAGRLDHANTAYKLLTAASKDEALELAGSLNSTNIERQSETARILKEALIQVEPQLEHHRVLVAMGENWPVGLVGLVSGRITEKYNRPSLVATQTEKGLTGSGRSILGFNITEALSSARDLLERFGGHEGACGFTIKTGSSLEALQSALDERAGQVLTEADLLKTLAIDAELPLAEIDFDLLAALADLEPYGMANPRPKFVAYAVRVADVSVVGKTGDHLRLRLEQGNVTFGAIGFGLGAGWHGVLNPGDLIDIVFEPDINEWNGRKDIQLKIVDIKKETTP